jgi:hypothetical protein
MPTNPGINNKFNVTRYAPQNRKVIECISKLFYITREVDPIEIGNSRYEAFLMRPADYMSVALNTELEIVVVLAEYETFEVRTLSVYSRIEGMFDGIRLDKSIRVLVSADTRIQDQITQFLLKNPEYPIVIPLNYSDVITQDADRIIGAIRQNYLVRDLFGYESPLRQEYFYFGRGDLIEDVIDKHKSNQNSGLFGLRKSGKTSTVYAIQRRAKMSGSRTVLIDCQDPNVHGRRYFDLLALIVEEARKELSLKKVNIHLGSDPTEVSSRFRTLMNEMLARIMHQRPEVPASAW